MNRAITLLIGLLHFSSIVVGAPSNLHTVLSPYSFSPSVEVLRSPVTKVETLAIAPTITKTLAPSASAVAIAGTQLATTLPFVQKIDSYSSGDSSNAEIRDLLRTLLSELRNANTKSAAITAPVPIPQILDSYTAPPRNTISDPNAPTYPDSFDNSRRINFDKPEKIVVVQQERRNEPIIVQQEAPVALKEIVRTVYQPVYVPVQYAPQPEVLTVAQPVTQSLPLVSAIPTSVKTGASAVAISTIHSSPALAIQQQQLSLPYVQAQSLQPVATVLGGSSAIYETSSGYGKK